MTSQAQAEAQLPGVRGLVFLGFPCSAGKPSDERAGAPGQVRSDLFLKAARRLRADFMLHRWFGVSGTATLKAVDDAITRFTCGRPGGRRRPLARVAGLDPAWSWPALEPRLGRRDSRVPVIIRHPTLELGKARCKTPCLAKPI